MTGERAAIYLRASTGDHALPACGRIGRFPATSSAEISEQEARRQCNPDGSDYSSNDKDNEGHLDPGGSLGSSGRNDGGQHLTLPKPRTDDHHGADDDRRDADDQDCPNQLLQCTPQAGTRRLPTFGNRA